VAQTINLGTNATASSTTTLTVGSTIGTSTTTLQAGSGGINLNSVCKVISGNLTCPNTSSISSEHFGAGSGISGLGGYGSGGLAVGNSAFTWGGTAIGYNAQSWLNSSNGIAIGQSSNVSNTGTIALGNNTLAQFDYSIALGSAASTTATNQLVVGSSTGAINSAYFGKGVTAASPSAFTLQSTGGSGTNVAGADLVFAGGVGTGTGNGGNLIFQTAKPGSTGATANSLSTVMTISGTNGSVAFQNSTNSTSGFSVGSAAGATQNPGQTTFSGSVISSPGTFNMGYSFTPNVNGTISRLGARNTAGTYTVTLYQAGATIASASVTATGTGSWAYTNITPVSVTAGVQYIVALNTGGANYSYTATLASNTVTGSITINEGIYASPSGVPSILSTPYVYGQPDITFNPSSGPTILTVDTTNSRTILGSASSVAGKLLFQNATNANAITLQSNATAASYTLNIPTLTANDTICVVTLANCSGAGATAVGAFDTFASANGGTINSGTLFLQSASATQPGLVNTITQTFAGAKTFTGDLSVGVPDTTGTLLVLDTKTTAGDPTGTDGAMYYNSNLLKMRCYQNGAWKNCDAAGTATKIVGTSATGGASGAVASVSANSADYVNTSSVSAQTTINSALTAVGAAGGGSVYLMEGTYIIDGTINIPTNTQLMGSGSGTIIKFKNGINANFNAIVLASSSVNIVARDLIIDGNAASQSGTNITMNALYLANVGNFAIATASTRILNVTVLNLYYSGTGTSSAVFISNSADITIDNLFAQNSSQSYVGVNMSSTSNIKITHSKLYNFYQDIRSASGQYNEILANTINGCIYLTGSTNNAITSNSFTGQGGSSCAGSWNTSQIVLLAASDKNNIIDNTFAQYNFASISIENSNYNNVSSNIAQTINAGNFVWMGSATYNNVSNNTVTGSFNNGVSFIYLSTGANYNKVQSNNLSDSGSIYTNEAITINGSYNTIVNNSIYDSSCTISCYAIDIAGGATKNLLSGNVFSGSAANAASINDVGTNTIYLNQQVNSTLSSANDITDIRYRLSGPSATAFQIQNSSAVSLLTVDTTNSKTIFNRATDGTILEFSSNSVVQGSITVSGTTVSYNAFTGSHYGLFDGTAATANQLVELTGNNQHKDGSSEPIYGITKSSTANSPYVLGAYLATTNPSNPASVDNPELIMAAGNGDLWIADNGSGNVVIGDPLISSGLAGHAMRDPGTYQVSHVFAKAAENIDWSTITQMVNGTKVAKISALFSFYNQNNNLDNPQFQTINVLTNAIFGNNISTASLNVSGNTTLTSLTVTGTTTLAGLTVTGNVTVQSLTLNGHLVTAGTTPLATVVTNAGTGAVCTVTGNDVSGVITLIAGTTGITAGEQCSLDFTQAYAATPNPVISARNDASSRALPYVDATLSKLTLSLGNAPTPGQTYTYSYFITQ
jgi:hypothetical protein